MSPLGDSVNPRYHRQVTEPPPSPRDRQATAARILAAAETLLAEGGIEALGINAVARSAGCDKQLIYRYFGGLEGLYDALGTALGQDLAAALTARTGTLPEAPAARLAALLIALAGVLRDDPRHRALALAATPASPALERLIRARGQVLAQWVAGLRTPSPLPDAPAIHALLIGAVEAAVAASARDGRLAGLPLTTPADWQRLEGALTAIAAALHR